MRALLVVSHKQAKQLIARAIAKRLKNTKKRVYFAYGSTNQLILNELNVDVTNYYNGHIDNNELKSNKNKPKIVILNDTDEIFENSITSEDIIIKGANALAYEDDKYQAAVAVASPQGGTYLNIFMKAACIGAKVIIPISHEKLVPAFLTNKYQQNSFDISMGLPVCLFKLEYGEVFTEIDAFRICYKLDAEFYMAGSIDENKSAFIFVVTGVKKDILRAKLDLEINDE